jgi:hypothetical protein
MTHHPNGLLPLALAWRRLLGQNVAMESFVDLWPTSSGALGELVTEYLRLATSDAQLFVLHLVWTRFLAENRPTWRRRLAHVLPVDRSTRVSHGRRGTGVGGGAPDLPAR